MRSACKTSYRNLTALMLTVLLMAGPATGTRAALITNGDFSTGDLTGWSASEGVNVVSYGTIPQSYASNWDLSPWNATMNGNFALLHVSATERPSLLASITTAPSTPVWASCNYAVAWEVVNPENEPNYDYFDGYFRIEVRGTATNGNSYPLGYNDIEWNTPRNGPTKGVVTGKVGTGFIDYSDRYEFTKYEIYFGFYNPFFVMSEIIGFDDVDLVTVPAQTGPAPVPEPASAIMLTMAGLAGMAGWRKKQSKTRKT